MATLKTTEKSILEKLFRMGDGYVLNFSDRTMGEFFRDDVGINIYDDKYNYASGSKANRMRGFWQMADNLLAGKSIIKLIDYIEVQILIGRLKQADFSKELIATGKEIGRKLSGIVGQNAVPEEDFVSKNFADISIDKVGIDAAVTRVLSQRISEIKKCLEAKASLAVIFLCGSTLEGVLLGVASANPSMFNQSAQSPKDKTGKVLQFHDWRLAEFINVANDLKLLGDDVKKFSHALRDFRNYIHPYQQMASGFYPDEYTAKICWHVLQAAIAQLANKS